MHALLEIAGWTGVVVGTIAGLAAFVVAVFSWLLTHPKDLD
jgi:hypothetical protein